MNDVAVVLGIVAFGIVGSVTPAAMFAHMIVKDVRSAR